MPDLPRPCWTVVHDGQPVLHLAGAWGLARLRELAEPLRAALQAGAVQRLDGSALEHLDTAAALLLLDALSGAGADLAQLQLQQFDERHARVVEVVRSRYADTAVSAPPRPLNALGRFGQAAAGLGELLLGHVEFFGRTLTELARLALNPRLLRLHELFAQLGQVGMNAIPVVALVTFLIGVVMAYMLGLQAEKYGANIFVVDGVALGMTREFSPLIVATIMAGRSGAAFTAQLGTMKLTEEIDAIRTLGLDPAQVLVLPRVLALMITLPLLVFVGDVMSLVGAMAISGPMLDIEPPAFLARLREALALRHVVVGLVKAPVFALVIAVIGTRMGMTVGRDTRAVGAATTSTVVQSIVAVILLDAGFAIVLQALEL